MRMRPGISRPNPLKIRECEVTGRARGFKKNEGQWTVFEGGRQVKGPAPEIAKLEIGRPIACAKGFLFECGPARLNVHETRIT